MVEVQFYVGAKIAHALNPTPESEANLKAHADALLLKNPPLVFRDDPANVLLSMENGHARLLVTLAECGCPDPERLTVFQFYTWLDSLEEKYEAQRNALTKNAAKR